MTKNCALRTMGIDHDYSGSASHFTPQERHQHMQTHPAVRVGFELATDGIQFYVLPLG